MPPPSRRFRIVFTTALVLALGFAWIRMPAARADEPAAPAKSSAPFDGVISANTRAMVEAGRQIPSPIPPVGSFDARGAERGKLLFNAKAKCATCHVPAIFTEPDWNMHTAAEMGIDDFQANRAPDKRYRTAPLKGLFAHARGGFYHDGRFATLGDVVNHYDAHLKLGLSETEKKDLSEYLKSL
jgi:hypothetical protein